jgi:hypothetical protein
MSTDTPEPANPPTDTLEEADEHGYVGQPPDPEPNESYTVEGVTSGDEEPAPPPAKSSSSSSSGSGSKSTSKSSS